MKNNLPKIHLFLSLAFFLLAASLFWYFYREVAANNYEADLLETEWRSEINKREEMKSLDNAILAIEKERAELQTHFAESGDIVPFLDTMEALAPKVGAKAEIASVDILPKYSGLLANLKVTGSFGSLYKFLALLENAPYEIELVSVDIYRVDAQSSGSAKGAARWEGDFKIKLVSFIE